MRSSCQVASNIFNNGPFADLAAKALSKARKPRGARRATSVWRRIGRTFSATHAGSGKGLAANVAHGGTKTQQLHVVDVGVAGNQPDVGVVQESTQKALYSVETFARAR